VADTVLSFRTVTDVVYTEGSGEKTVDVEILHNIWKKA